MANKENLIPQAHVLTVEEASKGGKNSVIARREKRTIQKILNELLDGKIADNPLFEKLSAKMGIQSDKSIKDVFTIVCLFNSIKEGNLSDLERLSRLLGEETTQEGNNGILDDLMEYLKDEQENVK
jgi:hypothetical protein